MSNKTKDFIKASLIRALKTVCQAALANASISTATVLSEVNWAYVASASVLAGVLSILTSIITGLPEVNE